MTKESKMPKERADHVMTLRLTESDWNLLVHVANTLGVSASRAARLMLRRADGGVAAVNAAPVIQELRDDLDDAVRAFGLLSRSLDRQGVLLNQIARKVNAGATVDAEAGQALRACQREFMSAQWVLEKKPGQMMGMRGMSVLLEESESWP
ncbi:hypothetical protein [Arthrobacter sp. GMC3]|uniref:hypothetical protein n=1 Tax=Arthrobacter sp. GMC3 TaxID=2058894 RepID=UPI0011B09698|nr:hypothetical protein [Arthrobacter sp. GMC3]